MPTRLGFIAFLSTALLLAPAAAQAAPADALSLEFTAPGVTAAIGSAGAPAWIALINSGDEAIDLPTVTLTVDASDLRGKAVVEGGADCTGDGSTLVCEYPHTIVNAHYYEMLPTLTVRATSAAQAGDRGTITVSVGAATATAEVTLAEPVSLTAGPEVSVAGDAGSTVTYAPSVTNTGERPINGVVFAGSIGTVSADYERKFSNCLYGDGEFYCTADDVLEPGKQYVPAEGVAVKIGPDAPAPGEFRSGVEWNTPTDAERWLADFKVRNPDFSAGTGDPLRLVEKAPDAGRAALRSGAQTDPDSLDNYTYVNTTVTGENLPDEVAIGASVSGAVDEVVEVKVGVKNLGPARVERGRNSSVIRVVIPAGAVVVESDAQLCSGLLDGGYDCWFTEVEVGQTLTATFTLRVTSAATSTGSVTVITGQPYGEPGPDRDRTNNTAEIVLNGTA